MALSSRWRTFRGPARCRACRAVAIARVLDRMTRRHPPFDPDAHGPPSRTCATPCVTAFSTSGCSSSGGTQSARPRPDRSPRAADPRTAPARRPGSAAPAQLARQRNPTRDAERERLAQEIRRAARTSGAPPPRSRRQGADRLEAVEEEVRIDLRAQRAQLRLPREHLQLQAAPLRLARHLEGRGQVADGHAPADRAGIRTPKNVGAHARNAAAAAGSGQTNRSRHPAARLRAARSRSKVPTVNRAGDDARAPLRERHAARDIPGGQDRKP